MRIKRRNLVWLGTLAALTGIAVLSQGFDSATSMLLLASLGVAGGVALFDLEPQRLIKTMQDKTALGGKVSADAREAVERAKARQTYITTEAQVLDVGLIATLDRADGMVMQRTRDISLDDNSVRPYVTLQVPALEADRRATVRFEMEDGHGDRVFIHEQEQYMRDGRIDILSGAQLPLFSSDQGIDPGDGDLRVYLNGDLISVLGFTIAPSTRDRWAGRRQQRAQTRLSDREDDTSQDTDDEAPVSLEELLRQQNRSDS
jgi:hypothetical protein